MKKIQEESPENQGQEQKSQRYVNLLSDAGFKAVFGDENNKEIVISFINAVLDGERVVKDLEYSNNEVFGKTVTSKGIRYDLHCTDSDGVRFTIEMQKMRHSEDFYQRSVYYGAKLYGMQQEKGSKNFFSQPVYVIGIMEGHLKEHPSGRRNTISRYRMTEKESGEVGDSTISCIFVELGCFRKRRSECESFMDKWCWCLKHIYRLMELPDELAGEIFMKLFEACEIAQFPQDKYLQYESDMMTLRDYEHDLYFSNKEGFEKGMEKGKAEEKRAMARTLLSMGALTIAQISEVTGLSAAEIEALR